MSLREQATAEIRNHKKNIVVPDIVLFILTTEI